MNTLEQPFDQIVRNPFLLKNLTEKMGFKSPTPIQAAVAAPIGEGSNLFAGAKTGSGKTIAFLAPIAQRILDGKAKMALVLAPTRELVLQIDEEAMRLLDGQTDIVSVPLYGGVPTDPQILAIKHHKPRIFIGTPGRILDLGQDGVLPFNQIDVCVLDEADRMCDMGFAPQVTDILSLMMAREQTLLFSATLPKELNEIMEKFCPNPVRIQVDASDESSSTIEHEALLINRRDKVQNLVQIIKNEDVHGIVFVKTRNRADEVHKLVYRRVPGVGVLHAGFSMGERERTIRDFREGKIRILVATDVVARGIDVSKVTHVIHYDLPDALEDYIHRSGRSGRAGRAGATIAMVEKDSREQMEKFQIFQKKVIFKPTTLVDASLSRSDEGTAEDSRQSDRSRGPRQRSGQNSRDGMRDGNRDGRRPPRNQSSRTGTRGPRSDSPRIETSRPDSKRARPASSKAPEQTKKTSVKPGLIKKTAGLLKKVFGRKKSKV